MHIFQMIIKTQNCSMQPSCYAGLYFVVLQISGIVLEIKIHRPSVSRSIRIVRQLK